MTTLDEKINEHFAGFVVRKDLVKAVPASPYQAVPSTHLTLTPNRTL